jgi:hypothetical protein
MHTADSEWSNPHLADLMLLGTQGVEVIVVGVVSKIRLYAIALLGEILW